MPRLVPSRFRTRPLAVALADTRGERVSGTTNQDSLQRYRTLCACADRYDTGCDPVDFAFAALDRVAKRPGALARIVSGLLGQPRGASVWQTVFLPTERRLVLSTLADRCRKILALDALDLSVQSQTLLWDMEARAEGDLGPQLRPYSRAHNMALVKRVYRYFQQFVPEEDQRQIAAFPDRFHTSSEPSAKTPV